MIEVYIDENDIIAVREGISIIINDASFALTAQDLQSLNLNGYGSAKVTTIMGDVGKIRGLEVAHIVGIEYKEGQTYSGREIRNTPPPEGSIILDYEGDPLKLKDNQWWHGRDYFLPSFDDDYTIIYLAP